MINSVKILLIEDDPFLLKMYATKFELEGFKVITVDDGEKGLKAIFNEKPNIVILDLMLPKINGFDVLKKIKENKEIKNIPVILLTNLSQRDEVKKGLALGAADYLIKAHFMPSEVVVKIKNILNN
jgi:DNA-binding response OmpR family regulator